MGKWKRTAPLTSEEARQQARAEGLTLLNADSKTGYFGVYLTNPAKPKPYAAKVRRGGELVYLECFATAEEAALCIARSPEGQEAAKRAAAAAPLKEAAKRAAAAPPLTSEEAQQQAEAEGLTLRVANNSTGYFGVGHHPGHPKPYGAHVTCGGKLVHLGSFATAEEAALCIARAMPAAEEAALCIARSPERRAAQEAKAEKAAAAREARLVAVLQAKAEKAAAAAAKKVAADQAKAEKAAADKAAREAEKVVAQKVVALLKRKRPATFEEARQLAEKEHFFWQCWQ